MKRQRQREEVKAKANGYGKGIGQGEGMDGLGKLHIKPNQNDNVRNINE